MSTTALQTNALTKQFKTVCALDGLNLEVPRGIIFGFLGPNGAGKTTTIHLLLGLLEPTAGSAEVLGFNCAAHSHEIRERSGALLEHTGLYERLSAEDNLEFYARVWHMSHYERRSRIEELLKNAGLYERRHERVGTWSRGMKQKLAVARAILHRPSLLFLDEPTAGLDPVAAATLREDIASLVEQEGITVFLTTHNLTEAEKLCARVGVISNGKLLAVGHPDTLKSETGKTRVVITGAGFTDEILNEVRLLPEVSDAGYAASELVINMNTDHSAASLVRLLVDKGVAIEEVRRSAASLEEAFLKIMEESGDI